MLERIYIPTVRRADNQITFDNLPLELQKRVIMVVDPNERHLYNYDCDYIEIPQKFVGSWTQLSQTRKFIHQHAGKIKYAMIDDDLKIIRRNSKYWSNLDNMEKSKRPATEDEILFLFGLLSNWLDEDNMGVVGLSDPFLPPAPIDYEDNVGVFGFVACNGNIINDHLDSMDLTTIRVAEDVLFICECLSRGIRTRVSKEWLISNGSMLNKDTAKTRIVWNELVEETLASPSEYFQTEYHYEALRYIQKKYPNFIKIFEKDGRMKNIKQWKKVYVPKVENSLESFME